MPRGESKLTGGHNLDVPYVIHTVGPKKHQDDQNSYQTLAEAYTGALALADDTSLRKIAFPALSSGSHRFNLAESIDAGITAVQKFSPKHLQEVWFFLKGETPYTEAKARMDNFVEPVSASEKWETITYYTNRSSNKGKFTYSKKTGYTCQTGSAVKISSDVKSGIREIACLSNKESSKHFNEQMFSEEVTEAIEIDVDPQSAVLIRQKCVDVSFSNGASYTFRTSEIDQSGEPL